MSLLDDGKDDFFDPLRSVNGKMELSANILQHEDIKSDKTVPKEIYAQSQQKEWNSFTKILMQRFPVSKTISISLVSLLNLYVVLRICFCFTGFKKWGQPWNWYIVL